MNLKGSRGTNAPRSGKGSARQQFGDLGGADPKPYDPPLDFLRKANHQWHATPRPPHALAILDFADDSPPADLMENSLPHPRDLPIVRQTEHETDQYMTDATTGVHILKPIRDICGALSGLRPMKTQSGGI